MPKFTGNPFNVNLRPPVIIQPPSNPVTGAHGAVSGLASLSSMHGSAQVSGQLQRPPSTFSALPFINILRDALAEDRLTLSDWVSTKDLARSDPDAYGAYHLVARVFNSEPRVLISTLIGGSLPDHAIGGSYVMNDMSYELRVWPLENQGVPARWAPFDLETSIQLQALRKVLITEAELTGFLSQSPRKAQSILGGPRGGVDSTGRFLGMGPYAACVLSFHHSAEAHRYAQQHIKEEKPPVNE